jgi:hypothetical protein
MLSCLDPDSFYFMDPDPYCIRKSDPDLGVRIDFKSRKALYLTSLNYLFFPAFFPFLIDIFRLLSSVKIYIVVKTTR